MYQDCKIINSSKKHKFTFIMLHPMECDSSYYNDFLCYFEKIKRDNIIFESIKFIFPESPIMDIDYPKNKQYNINSWYNYYTCYNYVNKIDKINIDNFETQTNRIVNIIFNEAFILNTFKKIYLVGVSQGGTILFNILNKIPRNLGGLFCIKSIYMDRYIKLQNNKNTPIFIFSGNLDKVYTIKFQKKTFKILKKRNYILNHFIINNLDHYKITDEEHNFIIENFLLNI